MLYFLKHIIIYFTLFFGLSFCAYAQLGFCTGNSGDPIFTETFGTGTTAVALPAGTTNYNFNASFPIDGEYLVSNNSDFFGWHTNVDHTGDVNGRYLTINADDSSNGGEFFTTTINGLCENTSYEFSAWLINILPPTDNCPSGGIPINLKFQILNSVTNSVLAEGDTGEIYGTSNPDWNQYGLLFSTNPGETSVILKMLNNGIGGCGNDLAIDDIVFKSCGDLISLSNETGENIIATCEDNGVIVSTTITASPDFSSYNSHAYQWQESSDNITWVDISGENSSTFTTPALANSRFFRVKVAEDPINVSNALCNVISETFSALLVPIADPPTSNGDKFVCANVTNPLTVSVPSDQIVNWYDAPNGGNLLLENSTSFSPTTSGVYFAAASSNLTDCFSPTRTALNYAVFELPVVEDETRTMCENIPIILMANVNNVSYNWNTGETTENIKIEVAGTYTVIATNSNGCAVTKTVLVEQIDQPEIDSIISDNANIIVRTLNEGVFEYALDNGAYQDSPVFKLIRGGSYLISVRGKNNCPPVNQEFVHFVIPKFFSPNGDSFNDIFSIQGLELFTNVEVSIFNRYGLLIKQSHSNIFTWDGTFNGQILPASDYWYSIHTEAGQFNGNFSLKR